LVYDVTVEPPAPALWIGLHAGGQFRLSWPTAATGFLPQFTTNLSQGTWSDLSTNNLAIDGTNNVLVEPNSGAAQFYRLIKR